MWCFLLKGIITKSDQKDVGVTFVRIRNSHEGNVQLLQKRKKVKKYKKEKKRKKIKKMKKQMKTQKKQKNEKR